ncbi:MAG TPA: hypothetical protein VF884_15615 [Nitrososphaeraceae archaeon]
MSEGFKESFQAMKRELSNKRKLPKDLQEKIGKESGSLETNYIIQCMKLLQDVFLYLESMVAIFDIFQKRDRALQEIFKLLLENQTDPSLKQQIDDILKKYDRPFSDL